MGKLESRCRAPLFAAVDGQERKLGAAKGKQATIVFDVAADMVRMLPGPKSSRENPLLPQKRIIYEPTNRYFYQVLPAEAYSKHGFNIHGVVFDEVPHAAEPKTL